MSEPLMKVGDVFHHQVHGEYKVTEYISARKVKIKFALSGHEVISDSTTVRYGKIRDPSQQLVFGVGRSYSEKYKVRVNNKKTPQYVAWENMLMRCYYPKTSRYSAYGGIGVKVCDEWLSYENFAKWYDDNYIDSYHLDKDLLGNGGIYSPENCCYIPKKLNSVFVVNSKNIGRPQADLPTGIYRQGGGYTSSVIKEKRYFATKEEAHKDYLTRKWNSVREIATEMYRWTEISEKVYDAVIDRCYKEQELLRTVYL